MRISGADMMQNIQRLQQVSNQPNQMMSNATVVTDGETDAAKMEISQSGRRMNHMMERMGRMDQSKMEAQMTEMKTALEDLNLTDLDLETMTDEEIAAAATSIHEVMESFKPEHAPSLELDTANSEISDLKAYITEFRDNSDSILNGIGQMENMMGGRPPKGPRPPQGGQGVDNQSQNAIEAYGLTEESTEEEELSVLEMILEALETEDMSSLFWYNGDIE